MSVVEYLKTKGIEIPKGSVSMAWFDKNDLPMIVECACCGMTMCSLSAYLDDDMMTYCGDCKNSFE